MTEEAKRREPDLKPEIGGKVLKVESDLPAQEIGGIPLPQEYSEKVISRKDLRIIGHRGYGSKSISELKLGEGLVSFDNTREGLELGIEAGANKLEIDFALTNDEDPEIVTAHLLPKQARLRQSKDEYLQKHPDAMTGSELMDWLYHQNPDIGLYIELKSPEIGLTQIQTLIRKGVEQSLSGQDFNSDTARQEAIEEGFQSLLGRIDFYTSNKNTINKFLEDKAQAGLTTEQLKLWLVTDLKPISEKMIDEVASLGTSDSKIFGLEQGGMPWLTKAGQKIGPALSRLGWSPDFNNIGRIADHAHNSGLEIVIGTVNNPEIIRKLVDQNVDGVVPDNAVDFEMAGIVRPHTQTDFALGGELRPTYESKLEIARDEEGKGYVPSTMSGRIEEAKARQAAKMQQQELGRLEKIRRMISKG